MNVGSSLRIDPRFKVSLWLTAAIPILAGMTVLAGWLLDFPVLKSLHPAWVSMKANAAICFILAGVSLLFLGLRDPARRAHWSAQIAAGYVLLLGVLTLAEYATGWDLGIDQLLFEESPGAAGTVYPGRMSPMAAVNFNLAGFSLLLISMESAAWRLRGQLLALPVGLTATLTLLTYCYGGSTTINPRFTEMAFHTAVTFLAVFAGILLATPGQGITAILASAGPGGVTARRLLPVALLFPLILGWVRMIGERAGLYDAGFSLAIFSCATMAVLAALILWNSSWLARTEEERLREEEGRRELEEKYKALVESANDAIITADSSGNIAYFNRIAERITGYSSREALGKPLTILMPKRFHEAHNLGFRRFQTTGKLRLAGKRLDLVGKRKNGAEFPLELTIGFFKTGGETFLIGMFRDSTDRKHAEAELRAAKEAAETASRFKSVFLAAASHEIRTPLTAILGYSDLLLDPEQTASDRIHNAQVIHRNGQHLLAIVNDLLDLSKIEAGKMTADLVDCSPMEIVSEVTSLMHVKAHEKKLEFRTEFSGPIPERIRTDPIRLKQILLNIVGNAIKFTDTGRVRLVTNLLLPPDEEDPLLCFEVIDTGPGIAADQRAGLFMPFSTLDPSDRKKETGTGLGLAISKGLAKLLGGDIHVQTFPGEGSSFIVTVRANSVAGARLIEPREGLLAENTRLGSSRRNMPRLSGRILLAEDVEVNRRLIATYLNRAGVEVEFAADGIEAVEKALFAEGKGEPHDLVLMDMQMPKLDGFGAVATLRSRGYRMPVIALTAHAMAGDRERCLRAGCTDFISKPIDREKLLAMISKYLKQGTIKRSSLESAAPAAIPAAPAPLESDFAADPDMVEIIKEFVEWLPGQLRSLEAAAETSDLKTLLEVSHAIKGAAGNCGFVPLMEAADAVEVKVRSGLPASDPALQGRVQNLIQVSRRVRSPAGAHASGIRSR